MTFLLGEHYGDEYYSSHVARYLAETRFARNRLRNVLELAGPVDGARVLDVGCGMGTFAIETAKRAAMAVGVDPALAAVRTASRLAARVGADGAHFTAGDAATLPFPDDSIDVVICADLTEHLDDETLRGVVAESRRVLRPGGRFALYTPSPTHLFERLKRHGLLIEHDPSHIGLRGMSELSEVIEAQGLRVARAYHRPTHIPLFRDLESVAARIPMLGTLFRRRVCISAVKPASR